MAAVYAVLTIFNLILSDIPIVKCSTHWVVTEDGKIQSQIDSVFNMKRPYDLVAFMKQEDRAAMLDKLKQELLSRKDEIDRTEDRDTGLEDKFYKSDVDCLAAGKQLPDLDLYISTVLPLENKGIRPDDYLPLHVPASDLMQPDCTFYTDLEYSPHAFEHLEGMKDRKKLSGTPELGLKNAITYQDNVDEYGHRIYEAFQQNQTSWVLYNMAAFYWRIKGDPYNVIECVRRALHYSPRHQKDVALISLANVLHRAQKSNEAAIVVHAALDISKELNVNHFTLGNIYAVLGEYNKSVICFENTLKIQPDFEAAARRMHAVLCHAKLESALEAQHRSLQRTLNDLKDYQKKHDHWQQQNDKLLAEQVPVEVKVAQHMAYEELKIKEISTDIGEYCRMGDRDGKQVLMCSWGKKNEPAVKMDLATATLPSNTENSKIEKSSLEVNDSGAKDYTRPVRARKYTFETVKAPRFQGVTPTHLQKSWPSKQECDLHVHNSPPDPRNLTSTFLCPTNKGYEVKPLLTEALGLKVGEEHPLPWYPPVCNNLLDIPEGNSKSYDHVPSMHLDQRKNIPQKLVDNTHTDYLLEHVNNGKVTIEELGQRILSGLKQNSGPKWILFNLAGLYWRIIGNNFHAVECFRRSIYTAPEDVQDVPEINLANVLYRWGRYEDARAIVRESMKLSVYEPATNFLMGNLEWALKNYSGAIYRYEQALEADESYPELLNTLRALKCYLKYLQPQQSAAPIEENGEEKCVMETRNRNKQGKPSPAQCGCQACCNSCCGISCPQPRGPYEPAIPNLSPREEELLRRDINAADLESRMLQAHEVRVEDFLGTQSCDTEDCKNLKVQTGGQSPHIKLEYINGQLYQKLIFAPSPNELTVQPEDCVLFNDGTRSEGCSRAEFAAYMEKLKAGGERTESVTLFINGQLTKILPLSGAQGAGPGAEHLHIHLDSRTMGVSLNPVNRPGGAACDKGEDSTQISMLDISDEEEELEDLDPVRSVAGPPVAPPPFQDVEGEGNTRPSGDQGSVSKRRKEIRQLPESAIPDMRKYALKRQRLATPSAAECKSLPHIDLSQFTSTWLSLSVKNIRLGQHLDLRENIPRKDLQQPVCAYKVPPQPLVDSLPGVKHKNELDYQPEVGLRTVLQKSTAQAQSVEVMGARIARALAKNETSWVLTSLAALYWRVRGQAGRAIDCLRVAVHTAPRTCKDVPMMSISNMLHRSGYINDAIVLAGQAMEVSPNLVVGHFNMANMFAVKGQWDLAAMFYESTLGLQAEFEPAKVRLKIVQCRKVVQPPPPQLS